MTNILQIEDPSGAVQKSIYALLKAAITDQGGPEILDTPPTGTPRPYINIGEGVSVPNNTKDIAGRRVTLTIHAWSEAPGYKELKEITAKIENAVTGGPLTPTGTDAQKFYFLNIETERSQHFTDENGRTKHGTIDIAVEVQKVI